VEVKKEKEKTSLVSDWVPGGRDKISIIYLGAAG
jgi:hypothetical protein